MVCPELLDLCSARNAKQVCDQHDSRFGAGLIYRDALVPRAAPFGNTGVEDDVQPPVRQSTPPVMATEARKHILPNEPIKPGEEHRFKIEYVPIARTLDTYGGRKLEDIERQLADIQARRQVRPHDELGTPDSHQVLALEFVHLKVSPSRDCGYRRLDPFSGIGFGT